MNDSHARIYAAIAAIPPGRVASYGAIAARAGLPGRARLVGRLLGEVPDGYGAALVSRAARQRPHRDAAGQPRFSRADAGCCVPRAWR